MERIKEEFHKRFKRLVNGYNSIIQRISQGDRLHKGVSLTTRYYGLPEIIPSVSQLPEVSGMAPKSMSIMISLKRSLSHCILSGPSPDMDHSRPAKPHSPEVFMVSPFVSMASAASATRVLPSPNAAATVHHFSILDFFILICFAARSHVSF